MFDTKVLKGLTSKVENFYNSLNEAEKVVFIKYGLSDELSSKLITEIVKKDYKG